MRPIIYPYKFGSKSARALSEELRRRGTRCKRVRPDGNYRPFRNHLIVNWGFQRRPEFLDNPVTGCGPIINDFEAVGRASNKLTAFRAMEQAGDVQIPEFTNNREEVRDWEGIVVERHVLSGHSGRGIRIVGQDDEVRDAPLYVKYVKKKKEFRVHVFQGHVIDVQQKRRRTEVNAEDTDYQVRNHDNGWVYCRNNIAPHQSVLDNAIAAVRALGLDFGGVDVIWNDHHNQAHVLEVNTAVGLEGETVNNYATAIAAIL